jgi:hypothetical protein
MATLRSSSILMLSGAESNADVVSHQMTRSIVMTAAAGLQPTQTRNRQHEIREL